MSQKLYRNVLRDAWAVTWRHPTLWVFGAFAFFTGLSQFFYPLFSLFYFTSWTARIAQSASAVNHWYIPLVSPNSVVQVIAGLVLTALVFFAFIVFVFLIIQSQGAIMSAGDLIFRKRLFSFKASWHAALEHFWTLAGVVVAQVAMVTVISAGVVLLGYILSTWPYAWWPKLVFVLGFVGLAVLLIFVTFSSLYATCYAVLEKQGLRAAYRNAVLLFIRHWLASIEIGVIFLILNIIAAVLAMAAFIFLIIPLVWFAAFVKAVTGYVTIYVVVLSLAILFLACWTVLSIYSTWFYMSVVILFDHMNGDAPASKVIRFLRSMVSRA